MSIPVVTIAISPDEELRVTRVGGVILQRLWFRKNGRWFPSRKGIDLPARAVGPLAQALSRNLEEGVER